MSQAENVTLDSTQLDEETLHKKRTRKPLMIVGMVSIVMLFAGLTSAYIVRQADGNWLTFDLPMPFFISTLLIVASSVSLWWAGRSAKKNDFQGITRGLGLTLLLAIGFIVSQFLGYNSLIDNELYFVNTNVSVSFLYIITFAHLLHLLGGVIALLVSWAKSLKQKYNSENKLGLELTSMYWHFLDGLWIYLLLFLLFIR